MGSSRAARTVAVARGLTGAARRGDAGAAGKELVVAGGAGGAAPAGRKRRKSVSQNALAMLEVDLSKKKLTAVPPRVILYTNLELLDLSWNFLQVSGGGSPPPPPDGPTGRRLTVRARLPARRASPARC